MTVLRYRLSIEWALFMRRVRRYLVYRPAGKKAWAARKRATRFRPADQAATRLGASRFNRAQGRGA